MKSAIEFHDSECIAIETDAHGNGVMILDAYVYRSNGEPSLSPCEGGWQRVRFSIESMRTSGEIGPLPADIYKGSLTIDGSIFDDLLPLPSALDGDVSLSLELLDAGTLSIVGKNISVTPEGEFRVIEQVNLR